jgi:hypothetical protein
MHPALKNPGTEVAPGVFVGQVIDLTAYRQIKCGQSQDGHKRRRIVVPGRTIMCCTKCGLRWGSD